MNKKHINWINALKALCILFVFLRHCENYYGQGIGWFDSLYLPFYVNSFFFVSGYLLFWKQMSTPKIEETIAEYRIGGGKTLFLNVLFRIIIPSTIFATIEFFPKKIIRGEPIAATDFFVETIGGCTYWFTSALVVAELLFLLFLMTRNRNIWFYSTLAFGLSILGWYLSSIDFAFVNDYGSFPWLYKHGLICMCYLALGGLYWKYEKTIRRWMKPEVVIVLTIAYIAISIYFSSFLYAGYMTSLQMIHPVGVLWSLLASLLLVELCKILPKNKFLTFIGQNSIGFYFMSGALPIVFCMLTHKIADGHQIWTLLIIWLVCMVVAYVTVMFINRWMPWLWDLRKVRSRLE